MKYRKYIFSDLNTQRNTPISFHYLCIQTAILYDILYILHNNPLGLSALPNFFAYWTKSAKFWSESLISCNFPLLLKLAVWLYSSEYI